MHSRLSALAAAFLIGASQLGAQEAPRQFPRFHAAAGFSIPRDESFSPGPVVRLGASHPLNLRLLLDLDLEYQAFGSSRVTYVSVPCNPDVPCFPEVRDPGPPRVLALTGAFVFRDQAVPTFFLVTGAGAAIAVNAGTPVRPQLTAGLGWEFHLGATPTMLEFRARTYPGAKWPMEKETFPVTVGFRF